MISKLIPKSLFTRFILIIMIPTVMAQLVATYVFYNRHWSNVSNYMIDGLAGEIAAIVRLKKENHSLNTISNLEEDLNLNIDFTKNELLTLEKSSIPLSLVPLYNILDIRISHPLYVNYSEDGASINILVELEDGLLKISASKKRVENPTTYIFIYWMTGTSTFFFLLSIIFSKNQIRPIIKLARVAEKFGKGVTIRSFKPEGALEVRKAATAFLKMKERIERQIHQRTEFLTGVSHDLRTPLTRIKLELAMCDEKVAKEIQEDVLEMEKMINAYLDFARGDITEKSSIVSMEELLKNIVYAYKRQNKNIVLKYNQKTQISIKKISMKRALSNIIDNAFSFGNTVHISCDFEDEYLILIIEDNGPSIIEQERENVFRPFYRIENSRNNKTGGIGLGLSIVRDIINNHGGQIDLEDSILLGGLKVIIKLPK